VVAGLKKQISCGNGRQEMQVQEPMRGSFAALKDDGEKQAMARATATTEADSLWE
jgi:hypothetical protein